MQSMSSRKQFIVWCPPVPKRIRYNFIR